MSHLYRLLASIVVSLITVTLANIAFGLFVLIPPVLDRSHDYVNFAFFAAALWITLEVAAVLTKRAANRSTTKSSDNNPIETSNGA